MKVHLESRGTPLCTRYGNVVLTTDLPSVSCELCSRMLDRAKSEGEAFWDQHHYFDKQLKAVGLLDWFHTLPRDTADERYARNVAAAFAVAQREQEVRA